MREEVCKINLEINLKLSRAFMVVIGARLMGIESWFIGVMTSFSIIATLLVDKEILLLSVSWINFRLFCRRCFSIISV